jgi:hypothetical protein
MGSLTSTILRSPFGAASLLIVNIIMEKSMKNSLFLKYIFGYTLFFVLMLQVPSFSWQGRMASTGDASGLFEDESDFLIHPAAIASSGKDTNAYSTFRINYKRISQWDNKTAIPSESRDYPYEAEGHEWGIDGNVGIAFPLGTGRMGLFFEYLGIKSDYSGEENDFGTGLNDHKFNIKTSSHFFNFNTIYGKAIGNVKFGGQIQFSHKNEANADYFRDFEGKNIYTIIYASPALDLYTYKIPFKSDYYESLEKLSVEGKTGTVKNTFTLKGGAPLPFTSNNKYEYRNGSREASMKGEVAGWNIGCDYWVRFPFDKDFSIPFLVSIEHKRIKRDGSGNSNEPSKVNYENETENSYITAGGGADFNLNKSTKIAVGIYYDYLQSNDDVYIKDDNTTNAIFYDYPNYPQNKENRITLKAMTEINISPGFSLISGLNAFFGKVKSKYLSTISSPATGLAIESDLTTTGYNWGINISFGTTYKTGSVIIEPFINAGYYKLKIDGDGAYNVYITSDYFSAIGESEKTDWIIGGGLSVKY